MINLKGILRSEKHMEIKLIAIDMDGTTLQEDHRSITKRTRRALEEAIKMGVYVVPATGRIFSQLPDSVLSIPGIEYAVTSNGAAVNNLKTKELLSNNHIGAGSVKKIMEMVTRRKIFIEVYCKGKSYAEHTYFEGMRGDKNFPDVLLDLLQSKSKNVESILEFTLAHADEVEKLNIPVLSDKDYRVLWQKMSRIKGVTLTSALANNIEVNHRSANKGEGLKEICKILNVKTNQIMAIGDSGNDRKMLELAGTSVAMGNAADSIKELADYVTLDYREDGVAHAIENLLLAPSKKISKEKIG